jgi:hypothetical protein
MTASQPTYLEVERKMPLMSLPVRTSIVPLSNARVLLSPASTLTEAQLRAAGAVTDVVAPSLLHGGGMAAAARVYPEARLWGPKGARERWPELRFHGELGVDPWPHEAELGHLVLDGMPRVRESVFLHRASQTLFVTDLLFNIEQPRGAGAWLILSMFGTWRRFAASRFFLLMVKDRPAFEASLARLATLEFTRVAPGHGALVADDAKPRLLAALRERGYRA